ncbi:PaREP1 family protein [Candidatus Bathyarchaeota archaeon]|nr:PaREP1 family protein [Candidatus Bathyarchaeota archaeon]
MRKGLDFDEVFISSIFERLGLDPKNIMVMRIGFAEIYLDEAKRYVERGDAVQASEKMYKVAEECIEILSKLYGLPESERAEKEGRWWIELLSKASWKLSKTLRESRIEGVWAIAYEIHVWGFHEAKLSIEDIEGDIQYVEWLFKITKEKIERDETSPAVSN